MSGSVRALVQLRFSNGMATTPWYAIDGLSAEAAERVASEVSGTAPHLQEEAKRLVVDSKALQYLERHATLKLTYQQEALLALQQDSSSFP